MIPSSQEGIDLCGGHTNYPLLAQQGGVVNEAKQG